MYYISYDLINENKTEITIFTPNSFRLLSSQIETPFLLQSYINNNIPIEPKYFFCRGFYFITKRSKLENMASYYTSICLDKIARRVIFHNDLLSDIEKEAIEQIRYDELEKIKGEICCTSDVLSILSSSEDIVQNLYVVALSK